MWNTLGDFKSFLLRGNVVDLAVAVVIGAAFGAVVTALVTDFITPLIGLILPGGGAFADRTATIGSKAADGTTSWPYAVFTWGHFVNTVVSFISIAAAVFFFVVRPVNKLMAMRKTTTDSEATTRECPECLSSVPVKARRCAFCTAQIGASS